LRGCVSQRDCIPAAQSIDVYFHQFMADDLATVESIYERAGLPMTERARAQLQQFITAHPRGKHGQVHYDLRQDFGIEPAALRERFDFYMQQFPVRVEVL